MIDLRPEPPPFGIAGVEVAAELRRDDEAIAPGGMAAEVVADDLLGVALRVEVRGVDEVAAELDEAIDDLLRLLDAGAPAQVFAEGHRAEAERADAEAGAAERDVVVERHGRLQSECYRVYRRCSSCIDMSSILNHIPRNDVHAENLTRRSSGR